MSGITRNLALHEELPEKFVRFLRTIPNLGDEVAAQMAEFIEDMRDTVELIQDRTEELDKLKNQLIVSHETIESLRNSIQETREARDESINEVTDNLEKAVKRYSQQLEDVVREKNFLSIRIGELEDDKKMLEGEKKSLEEDVKNSRRCCERCWRECTLDTEAGYEEGVDDFDQISPLRGCPKLSTSLSPLEMLGCDGGLEDMTARIARLTEQNRELEEGNQKLRDENDELYRQLDEGSLGTPIAQLFGEEGNRVSFGRPCSNLLEQLEAVEATPDRSFLRMTRSRSGLSDATNWMLPDMSNAENQTCFLDTFDGDATQCDTPPLRTFTPRSESRFLFPTSSPLLNGFLFVIMYFLTDSLLYLITGVRVFAWSPSRFEGPVY